MPLRVGDGENRSWIRGGGLDHSSSEDMILRAAQQLANPYDFPIDPSLMNGAGNPHLDYTSVGQYQEHQSASGDFGVGVDQSQSQGTPAPEGENRERTSLSLETNTGDGMVGKKKASNPKSDELRRLWRENESRSMEDVTAQLRRDLVDPQSGASDKSKHVFGMLWYFACRDCRSLFHTY